MGYRDDDILADDRADLALKRLLATDIAQPRTAVPGDLVARTLNRLPPVPPAQAAQHQASRRRQMRLGAIFLAVPIVLCTVEPGQCCWQCAPDGLSVWRWSNWCQ